MYINFCCTILCEKKNTKAKLYKKFKTKRKGGKKKKEERILGDGRR